MAVEGDTLVLAGADVVTGTPVLDVKPYLPFCDAVPDATAPDWVRLTRSWPLVSGRPGRVKHQPWTTCDVEQMLHECSMCNPRSGMLCPSALQR